MEIIAYKRILARRLLHQGKEYSTAIAEISADRHNISITPFECETAATTYESRPLHTFIDPQGMWWLALIP